MKTKDKTIPELKEFGHVMAIVLILLSGFLIWKQNQYFLIPLTIAVLFILTSIFFPRLLKPIEKYWMIFGLFMGTIITHIILTVLYFLVVTPLALVLRSFGKKFLDLEPDSKVDSYWIEVPSDGPSSRPFLPY